ncbi:MAG: hypothetical protein PVS3B3_33060 [Ktedonobacteraceae bacterium]
MSKTRKRSTTQKSTAQATRQVQQKSTISPPRRSASRGSAIASRMDATQGMLMPAFVALGCWGLAISFLFFFPDPNHILYGGMAAAMGLIWSIIVGLRISRVMRMSREGRIYK